MEQEIKNMLKSIEEQYKVHILYACETGSRAWGFPSPDSDYDVRMIYKHDPDWYLSLSEKKDTIEMMANDGDLDITGWDIRKCMKLMWKSNGALLERVQSPIVYHEEPGFAAKMRAYAEKCFAPVAAMHHYMGMAHTSFEDIEGKEEVKLKKLFYALRAALACKWIRDKDAVPPIVFITMVNELDFDEALKTRIKELIALKSGKNESYVHTAEPALNVFIREQLEISANVAGGLRGRKEKEIDLDSFFLSIIKSKPWPSQS